MSEQRKVPAKRLVVAIPCLNEASTISEVVRDVPRDIAGIDHVDVLVVDDGSADETSARAVGAGAVVVRHAHNLGVGKALQTAVNYAVDKGYDLMVNIDGDRQFDPRDIPKLVLPLLEGRADIVSASRFIDSDLIPDMPRVKLIGNRMMSRLISRMVGQKFYDVSCGFRSYSREALLRLNLEGAFTYTQETFLDCAVKGLTIIEIPIEVKYLSDRKSRVSDSVLKYGISTARIIFRTFRDYFPLRFFWGIALVFAIPSIFFASIFLAHYIVSGQFTGFLFAGFLSAFCAVMSTVFFVVGIVADMLDRIRSNQERILYYLKKQR